MLLALPHRELFVLPHGKLFILPHGELFVPLVVGCWHCCTVNCLYCFMVDYFVLPVSGVFAVPHGELFVLPCCNRLSASVESFQVLLCIQLRHAFAGDSHLCGTLERKPSSSLGGLCDNTQLPQNMCVTHVLHPTVCVCGVCVSVSVRVSV